VHNWVRTQEINKPLWTVDGCNPSPAVLMSLPILSLSQARSKQTVTCGKSKPCLQDADEQRGGGLNDAMTSAFIRSLVNIVFQRG